LLRRHPFMGWRILSRKRLRENSPSHVDRGNARAPAILRRVIPDFDALYRRESRRVPATLIHLLGDFDLAEEATAEAFRAAIEQWPTEGVPASPRAWLVLTRCHPALALS
jgi:RNA polymerase sigma-70 factor (ECF subfamily)